MNKSQTTRVDETYLSIKDAIEELKAQREHIVGYMSIVGTTAYDMGIEALEVQSNKGKWITYRMDITPHPLHCSLCGFGNHHISNRYMKEFKRCPNCGAEMEVEE